MWYVGTSDCFSLRNGTYLSQWHQNIDTASKLSSEFGAYNVEVLNIQCVMFIVVLDFCCYASENEGRSSGGVSVFEVDVKPSRLPSEKQ